MATPLGFGGFETWEGGTTRDYGDRTTPATHFRSFCLTDIGVFE